MNSIITRITQAMLCGLLFYSLPALGQLAANGTVTQATCGLNNGSIALNPSGGSGYTYQWAHGPTTSTISALAPGNYTVTVYSGTAAGVDTVFFETFDPPQAWTLNVPTGVNGADNNFWEIDDDEGGFLPGNCGNANNGNQTLHITSVFNPAGGASYDAGGLCGILFCPETNMGAISPAINTTGASNMTLSIDFIGNGDALLDNGSLLYSTNGGVTVTPLDPSLKSNICPNLQGEWANRTYALPAAANNIPNFALGFNWTNNDDGIGTDPSIAINNILITYPLGGGLDSVVATFTINPSTVPTITVAPGSPTICPGATLQLVASGGTGGTYTWTGGDLAGPVTGDTLSVSPVASQTYNVNWTDGNCSAGATAPVNVSNATVTLTLTAGPNDTVCAGTQVTLNAVASVAGGIYTWSGGDLPAPVAQQSVQVTPASNHVYTVSYNAGGCIATDSIDITILNVQANLQGFTNPSCGLNNGSITASGVGGSVSFLWLRNGVNYSGGGSVLTNVPTGNYTFIALDQVTGCADTVSNIILTDTTTFPVIQVLQLDHANCFGDSTGGITIGVIGGSGTYTFAWSHNAAITSGQVFNLPAGNYTVSVNDGVCPVVDSTITVNGPTSGITVQVSTVPDNCGQAIGSATATVSGGTTPYQYNWNNGGNTATISNLIGLSTYDVTVTDDNGCTATGSGYVDDAGAPTATITGTPQICPNGTEGEIEVTAAGPGAPYSYTWSHDATLNSPTPTGLAAGTYTVTVTSSVGCTVSAQFVIGEFSGIVFNLPNDTSIYAGQSIQIQGTTNAPYTDVIWSPDVINSPNTLGTLISPDDTITYHVDVVYGTGCIISDSITINVITNGDSVIVPNVFTPDGDGLNDFFRLRDYAGVNTLAIYIYDRWGNKVYEAFDPTFMWDGTDMFSGIKPMTSAVFGYLVEYTTFGSFSKKRIEGNVTLIR